VLYNSKVRLISLSYICGFDPSLVVFELDDALVASARGLVSTLGFAGSAPDAPTEIKVHWRLL